MSKKIKRPSTFSEAYKVDPKEMAKLGVLDPVLNVDTKLFIDPLLLSSSKHPEFRKGAAKSYQKRFQQLITLLENSTRVDDIAWKTAEKLATFPEITGTCLGYGAGTIRGRAWGKTLRHRLLAVASETIRLGIKDIDLFLVISLIEDGIGPDLISDMTTNIILSDLEEFNARICSKFGIKTEVFTFKNGSKAKFPVNPLATSSSPVILVPTDILRELPIATSWEDVGNAAAQNAELRNRVNTHIGRIWQSSTRKKRKEDIRKDAYTSKEAFLALLDSLHAVPKEPYDVTTDPNGHLAWMRVRQSVAKDYPLSLSLPKKPTIDEIHKLVTEIIDHYRDLVENKGLWKELWTGSRRRPEKSAQRVFFAVADVYCKINDIDVTPEADSGVGPVDFKFATSYKNRVLVELKLSSNTALVPGYERQLEAYKKAEKTMRASYVVIDVGGMGTKDTRLTEIKNRKVKDGEPASVLEFIDGKRQKSASKR